MSLNVKSVTHEEVSVSGHATLVRRSPPQAEPSGLLGDYVCRSRFSAVHGISSTYPLIRSTERQLHDADPATGPVGLSDPLGQTFVKLATLASSPPVQAVLCHQHCHPHPRGRNKDGTSMKLSQPTSTFYRNKSFRPLQSPVFCGLGLAEPMA